MQTDFWAKMLVVQDTTTMFMFTLEQEPIFVARRQVLSNLLRESQENLD